MFTRRTPRPASRPLPDKVPSFADGTVFGQCESASCSRHARAACDSCGGEYCLAHGRHPGHEQAAATP